MILEAFTDAYVEDMLARHAGNVSHAAEAAGVARRHFQRLKSE
jgi:DNA-binding NtrC family response regulator